MKKLLLLLMLLPMALFATESKSASVPLNTLRIVFNDKTELDILLTDNPELSFIGSDGMRNLHIITSDNSFNVNTEDIDRMYFLDKNSTVGTPDIILDPETDNEIAYADGILILRTTSDGIELSIFDITGKVIRRQILPAGSSQISLVNLNHGTYIVKFGNKTIKATVR